MSSFINSGLSSGPSLLIELKRTLLNILLCPSRGAWTSTCSMLDFLQGTKSHQVSRALTRKKCPTLANQSTLYVYILYDGLRCLCIVAFCQCFSLTRACAWRQRKDANAFHNKPVIRSINH